MKKRVLSITLAASICAGLVPNAAASEPKETAVSFQKVGNEELSPVLPTEREVTGIVGTSDYAAGDRVRVSIVLEGAPAIRQVSEVSDFTDNARAVAYRKALEQMQFDAAEEISSVIGEELDVVWNLTLAANIISAEVDYGDIEAIKNIDGISDVIVETQYDPCTAETAEPNMKTSGAMIGSSAAWAAGYTGAGSLVAVIDSGTDTTHQSFDAGAFDYAIEQTGKEIDLLDVDDIAGKLTQLNAYQQNKTLTAEQLYRTSKLAYAYNYVDEDLDVTHLNDDGSEHGSHVAGIATANRYIPDGKGGYTDALTAVHTQGVAPDAQLITMKVFGKNGGAYDSDYMAAIEDAIVLGADSINLSLGSASAGVSYSTTYQELLEGLVSQGAVVNAAAGNDGNWQENTSWGYLYSDGVNMQTAGSPGTYTNMMSVASVDNTGETGQKLMFSGVTEGISFYEDSYGNQPIGTLDTSGSGTEYGFVLFENIGVTADGESLLVDYADVIRGKVALVMRGVSNFSDKHSAAAKAGAVACVVVNNEPGSFGMDLSKTKETIPCISISQEDGNAVKAGATAVRGTDGSVLYYTGTVTIRREVETVSGGKTYTMSDFSSWGLPGSLELKPEITAPGGNIYSVFGAYKTENGAVAGGSDQYENMSGTSMATPQVTGMAAVFAQFYRENGLAAKTGISQRKLFQSLLMSTATPLVERDSGSYYSLLNQGAGLANVNDAINAHSYLTMDESANAGAADGKVKVELGDAPDREGVYTFDYTIHNLLDENAYYELETDVFTQDVFTYSGIDFLDTSTVALKNAVVTYRIDGATLDDPGVYTELNAQLVLNALAEGTSGGLPDKYDLDGDGKITSYDAHLILAGAEETEAVCVPANGSVTVTVTLDVTGCDLSAYPNGAYIQAYSYAKEHATAEGLAGTIHSIPVLGFYGNWSDASMFDVGTMAGYWYDTEDLPPYLLAATGCQTNVLTIKYAGDNSEYFYLGNPVALDDTYLEKRNAFNSDDMLFAYYYTLIRNADAVRVQIVDVNDPTKIYYDDTGLGKYTAAYYYDTSWSRARSGRRLRWQGTDAEGNKLPEGTEVEISLTMAPEYYVTYERTNGTLRGTVDWDALGKGAHLTTRLAIDNTAPEVMSIRYNETENKLNVVAKDGQYLAQVALYERGATEAVGAVTPNQTEKGTEFTATFDVSKLNKNDELYVQVIDYAMNISTYKLVLGGSDDKQTPTAITVSPATLALYKGNSAQLGLSFTPWLADERVTWTSSKPAVATVENGVVTALEEGSATITATSVADPAVSGSCTVTVQRRNVTLFGVLQDEDGDIRQFSWNMKTQDTWQAGNRVEPKGDLVSATYALAGADTVIYLMDDDSTLYQVDPATGAVQKTFGDVMGYPADDMDYGFVSSIMLDCDILYGVYGSYVLISAPEDPTVRYVLDMSESVGNANLVTIAYAGYYMYETGKYMDVFYCLTTGGQIYLLQIDLYNLRYGDGLVATDLDLDLFDYNCSMTLGDDGALYLSHYNSTENASEIYLLEYDKGTKEYVSTKLGSLGQDVWPGALLMVTENGGGVQAAALDEETAIAFPEVELKPLTLQKMDTLSVQNRRDGGLNAAVEVRETSAATEGRKTVLLKVSVNSATNGLVALDYDETALTFVRATGIEGALSSAYGENGALLVAYAAKEVVSGEITLTFRYDSTTCPTSTGLRVTTMEENSVLTPGETTELTLTLRESSSGGGGGGSVGSSAITVPVTSDSASVNVQVTVTDGTAAVKVSDKQLEKLIEDGETDVVVDVSGLNKVDSAKLPAAMVKKLGESENVNLTVTLTDGSVTLDSTALARLGGGADVTVSVTAVAREKLTDSQKAALDSASAVAVVDVDILSGGVKISNFNGGKLTIAIPYTPAEGEDTSGLTVWFVREDGTVEELGGWYDAEKGCFLFETGHLSRYLLVNVEKTPEFSDVAPEDWYASAVLWAVKNGITDGVGENLFAPERVCTRGEIVTLLWRAAGAPKAALTATNFTDVSEDAFCYDAVLWAAENGITDGVGENLFAPERVCTRGEIVTLLWRTAGAPKAALTATNFTDVSADAFCYDAVRWAVESAITDGIGDGLFGAGNFCTRAEVVTLLYRLSEN